MYNNILTLIVMGGILFYLVQYEGMNLSLAAAFFGFVLLIFVLRFLTDVNLTKNLSTTSKQMIEQYGKPLETKMLFYCCSKKYSSSHYIKHTNVKAKLHIYETFTAVELCNRVGTITKDNIVFDDLPAKTSFGIKLNEGLIYFYALQDINSIIKSKLETN